MAQTVKVVARFRPPNSLELREGGQIVVSISEDGTGVKLRSQEAMKGVEAGGFTFDKVFDMQATQAQVFNFGVREIVDGQSPSQCPSSTFQTFCKVTTAPSSPMGRRAAASRTR